MMNKLKVRMNRMRKWMKQTVVTSAATLLALGALTPTVWAEEEADGTDDELDLSFLTYPEEPLLSVPEEFPEQFKYDSGIDIAYPEDGVKGVFVTAHSAGGQRLHTLTELLNKTELNAMVIDVKDDYGDIVMPFKTDNELINQFSRPVMDP